MAENPNDDSTVILGSSEPSKRGSTGGSQNALPIGSQLGEFEIVDLIGEGGFGIVYLAQDHSLHRKVAVKEYMPSALAGRAHDSQVAVRSEKQRETFSIGLRSFVNEARILAQYDHPALIKVFRFWEANGTAYMAMPFLNGKNLRDVLKERGTPPDEAWICKILSPVMDALELIHADQCYHRDIAPDNIMLLPGERPVLLDFGAARRVISDMTQALTVILKPGYAPIEQYAEMPGMKQGPWTDIYALAAVVYFMILNQKPPPSVGRMMQDSYEPLALAAAGQYSDRFLQGVDKCLAVKSEDRPQTIAEMRELIGFGSQTYAAPQKAAKSVRKAAPVSQRSYDEDEPGTQSKIPLLIAGGLVIAAAAGGYYYLQQHKRTETTATTTVPAPVAASPATAASSSVAAPPSVVKFAGLAEALDGAARVSDARFAPQLDAPASILVGNDLKLNVSSKADGFVYLFVWDQAEDKVYRVFPNDAESNNVIKAGTTLSLPTRPEAWKFTARTPLGNLRSFALISATAHGFAATGFVRDGSFFSVDRKALDTQLSDAGLTSLIGTPQCTPAATCADHFAFVSRMTAEQEPVAEKPKPSAAPKPAPTPTPTPKKQDKADAEREYMKRLNKDLDNLLGK